MNKKIGITLCAVLGIVSLSGCNNLANGLNLSKVDSDVLKDGTESKEEDKELKVKGLSASGFNEVYSYGEPIDHEGTVVTATFSDDSTKVIEAQDLTFSPAQGEILNKTGAQLVTVKYRDYDASCEYSVSVNDGAIVSIYAEEYKEQYYQGEYFDTKDLKITGVYQSGKKIDVTDKCRFNFTSSTRFLETGNKTVNVSYIDSDLNCQFDVLVNEAIITRIRLKGQCKTNFALGETFNHDGLTIEAVKSNDDVVDVTNNCTFYPSVGSVLSTSGTNTVSIIHNQTGERLSYKINVTKAVVKSICASGYQGTYAKGKAFTKNGLVINALMSDGSSIDITNECVLDIAEGAVLNEKTEEKRINVTHQSSGKTCFFNIKVTDSVIESIEVSCSKTFKDKETIKKSDLTVKSVYSDNTKQTLETNAWICNKFSGADTFKFELAGPYDFEVDYNGFKYTLRINVVAASVNGIEVTCLKSSFVKGLNIVKSDLKVIAKYDNSSTVEITDWTCDEFVDGAYKFTTTAPHTFTIKYGEFVDTVTVSVEEPVITSIDVSCLDSFKEGDKLYKSNISVVAHYNNNTQEDNITGWTCDDFTGDYVVLENPTQYVFTIKYGGKQKDLTIDVAKKVLVKIEASVTKSFIQNQNINKSDFTVTAYYDNNTSGQVTAWTAPEFESSDSYNLASSGTHAFVISYECDGVTKNTTVNVDASAPVITKIAASCDKTYKEFDVVKKADIKVVATYNNGNETEVINWNSSELDGENKYKFETFGSKTINIAFGGHTTSLTVTATQRPTYNIAYDSYGAAGGLPGLYGAGWTRSLKVVIDCCTAESGYVGDHDPDIYFGNLEEYTEEINSGYLVEGLLVGETTDDLIYFYSHVCPCEDAEWLGGYARQDIYVLSEGKIKFGNNDLVNNGGAIRDGGYYGNLISNYECNYFSETYCRNVKFKNVIFGDDESLENMFASVNECNVESVVFEDCDATICTECRTMFYNCHNLKKVDFTGLKNFAPETMNSMFEECWEITDIKFGNIDTSNCYSFYDLFSQCKKITTIDISSFTFSSATQCANMFRNCCSLETIYASDVDFSRINGEYNFEGCEKLVGGAGTKYNANNVSSAYACMDRPNDPGYFTDVRPTFLCRNISECEVVVDANVGAVVYISVGATVYLSYGDTTAKLNLDKINQADYVDSDWSEGWIGNSISNSWNNSYTTSIKSKCTAMGYNYVASNFPGESFYDVNSAYQSGILFDKAGVFKFYPTTSNTLYWKVIDGSWVEYCPDLGAPVTVYVY